MTLGEIRRAYLLDVEKMIDFIVRKTSILGRDTLNCLHNQNEETDTFRWNQGPLYLI